MEKYNYCPHCGFDIIYDEGEFKGEVMSHYCVNDEYIIDVENEKKRNVGSNK